MDYWESQKLAQLLLGLNDEQFNLIINTNESDLDGLLKKNFNVN
jgi:hypothetical protein